MRHMAHSLLPDWVQALRILGNGEVSEWPKEPISKIGRCGDVPRGFESHPLRQVFFSATSPERCWSGRSGTPGKRVGLQGPRGFESHPLRQPMASQSLQQIPSYPRLPRVSRCKRHFVVSTSRLPRRSAAMTNSGVHVSLRNCWINGTMISGASSWQKCPALGRIVTGASG